MLNINMFKSLLMTLLFVVSATVQAVTIRYQHTDMLGSVIAETDASGNVLSRSHYEPFGKRLGGDKAGIGFTGHLQDEDLNLTYMQARYYDPLIGRFYSNDPVDTLGHMEQENPAQGFNRYAYANNNPYKYTDPDGEFARLFPALVAAAKIAPKAYKVYKSNQRIKKVLKNKTSTGKKNEYKSSNGSKEVDKNFNTLTKGSETKTYENGTKVGKLPDGRKVDQHASSGKSGKGTDVEKGTPSIKITNESGNKTQTTIRYPEVKK
ncbi:hypothetical protein J3L11_18330 [Shewanella sp. 4t3-1-2LB]|uniref:RHS repeat domain-containing protein n=1 Tax=Shewanella sp. 4t3-1-2LB TaxID=2817682 RepID=UPI001A9953D5|nr:RHS repeat-associated core domain-containing protein [Shewanella sp. 4t3-1-2LB]MBO1273593.1 hypothetical protein [Shewanella sp. 4t3-1-2LB]